MDIRADFNGNLDQIFPSYKLHFAYQWNEHRWEHKISKSLQTQVTEGKIWEKPALDHNYVKI